MLPAGRAAAAAAAATAAAATATAVATAAALLTSHPPCFWNARLVALHVVPLPLPGAHRATKNASQKDDGPPVLQRAAS